MASFLFYDLETFGADPRHSRIAQFAAIRTDLGLNEIEEPVDFMVRPANDVLPSPGATLVTGILPQQALRDGVNEAEAFARIVEDNLTTTEGRPVHLDYTLERPVGAVAKKQWQDDRSAERDHVMATLSQRYGLFYFYAQSCGACELFSPILRSVADSHRMAVMAVSMDVCIAAAAASTAA